MGRARNDVAIDSETLRAWANERLGKTQRIAYLSFIDDCAQPDRKILKRELRDRSSPAVPTPKETVNGIDRTPRIAGRQRPQVTKLWLGAMMFRRPDREVEAGASSRARDAGINAIDTADA